MQFISMAKKPKTNKKKPKVKQDQQSDSVELGAKPQEF